MTRRGEGVYVCMYDAQTVIMEEIGYIRNFESEFWSYTFDNKFNEKVQTHAENR